ncbi:MAG: CBS domain-containing protein [Candidatus Nanoarchaeia archaeon]
MATVADVMSTKFVKIDADDPIRQALAKLIAADERYGLVFDKKHKKAFRGLLDRVRLIESKLDPNAKAGTFTSFPPVVNPETSLLEAARLIYQYYPCILPVQRKNQIIGVVRSRDILPAFIKLPALSKMKCIDIATINPITFEYNTRLGNVINVFKEKEISHAPIVDKQGRLLSVFSLTDLYKHIYPKGVSKFQGLKKSSRTAKGQILTGPSKVFLADKDFLLDMPVGDFASVPLFTAKQSDTLSEVLKELYEHRISDLVITENKKPIGIITTRDILKAIIETSGVVYWPIQFIGCEALPGQLFDSVREQVAEFYEKALRLYIRERVHYFRVQIKRYEKKETKRQKYSVHLRLALASKTFTSEYAHFDLNTAVSWALKALNQQLLNFKEKSKEKYESGKKGRRALFEHYVRKSAELQHKEKVAQRKLIKRGFAKANGLLVLLVIILLLLVIGLWFYPDITKNIVGAAIAKLKSTF